MVSARAISGNEYPGILISFESLDSSGNSSQVERTAQDLRAAGHDVLVLREPGGTKVGELVRAILKADTPTLVEAIAPAGTLDCPEPMRDVSSAQHMEDKKLRDRLSGLIPEDVLPDDATATAQMFLLNASRAQLVETVIRPALAEGKVVILDRYVDSTVAYQSASGGIDPSEVLANCMQATGGLEPQLTIYCRLDPDMRLARMRARGEAEDAIERTTDFASVAKMFDFLARSHPERFEVVDAGQSIDDVAAQIKVHVDALMNRPSPPTTQNPR